MDEIKSVQIKDPEQSDIGKRRKPLWYSSNPPI